MNVEMRNLLLAWYDENKRELPWRAAASAYHVWISEVMLQQTRAEAVKGYYTRFLAALPDTAALAAVDDDRLLKLWEGLGYYTRARCMKKAARIVMDEYGGALPASPEALLRLPGIGLYTAGAIASIAYGIPVPAVDGNVLRVLMRLHAQYDDITLEATRKETARRLLELIPRDRPGDFNQSLMELGAVVCLPNGAPRCAACPLAWHCLAHTQKLTAQLPVRAAKKARRVERRAVLILRHEGRTALRKRGSRGLLAGLWELPNALEDWPSLARELGVAPEMILSEHEAGEAKHIFTHIEWHMRGTRLELARLPEDNNGLVWVTERELQEEYALPSAFGALRKKLFLAD